MHHVTELYDEVSSEGNIRRTAVDYDLRFVFPAELELLLSISGLCLRDCYGDYDLGPFCADSERLICVAERSNRGPGRRS